MKILTPANKSAISRIVRDKYSGVSLTWKGQSANIIFPENTGKEEYEKIIDWLEYMILRRFKINIVFDTDSMKIVP